MRIRRLAILGAGGHGRVVADAALLCGWTEVSFFDERWPEIVELGPWKVVGTLDDLVRDRVGCDAVVVAIGDNRARITRHRELIAAGLEIATIVHPSAVISRFVEVGRGATLLASAVLNPFARLGEAVIVNTGATVDHDCGIADGVHISPGAHLGGSVRVGEGSWIGIGAVVRNDIVVGAHAMVGAGAVVIDDVVDGATVVGVPAKMIRSYEPR